MQMNAEKWIVPAVIGVHLAIALPLAYYLNIWVDEASSLYATEHGFWIAFQNAAEEQKQAPLYFWILSLWRLIDGSIFFARLFSIGCSVSAIALFSGLASRVVDRRAALLFPVFFGLHPFLIWASLEIRVYALVILVSIILMRLFFSAFWDADLLRSDGKPRYPKIWLLFAVIIALYTNYYLGFLIAGLFASLLFTRRWRDVRAFALIMVAAAIAFFPLLVDLVTEFQSKSSGFQEPRSLVEGLQVIWNHVLTFVLPTEIFPGSEQSAASWIRVWIVRAALVLVAAVAILNRKQIAKNTVALGAVAVTTGLFLLAAYFLVGSAFVEIRHASVLFVPLILFLASLISDIGRKLKHGGKLLTAAAVVILSSFAYAHVSLYPNLRKPGDWARVGEFIQTHELPNQPIVVFEAFDALALPYYYGGPNRILPDENFFDFNLQAPAGSRESMIRQIEFVISEVPPDAPQIWLVVNDLCISTEACRPLEKYVEANYTIELEKEFYRSKVYLLRRKDK
jgi:hypothetical protein